MKKIVYHISGFDCPNCAAKVERYLNKDENINEATLDFANDRLYINYREEPYTLDELKNKIKEVESDPLRIELINKGTRAKTKIFTKKFIFDLSRIILAIIFFTVAIILEHTVGVEHAVHDSMSMASMWNVYNWIANILYILAGTIMLYDIVWKLIQNIVHKRNPIDMNLLLTISCIGVFVLSFLSAYNILRVTDFSIEMHEGAMVVILYQIGELIEAIATGKSKAAISKAIDLRADTANLVCDDKIVQVKPETLKVGDVIIVRIGEIIPADGEVIEGQGTLDMSSLTGEPMPVDALVGSNALSGSILRSGSITVRINKVFADSTISKILELVESSGERKAKVEKFIDKFAKIYTPTVFAIGVLFAIISGLVTQDWAKSLFYGLAILVVSCPCAIVISVPLAYFAGIGLASKRGVIIKGANYLDSLCNIGVLFLDKTGTLTYGNFEVKELVTNGVSEEELKTSLLAAESRSNHPIAKAIILHQNVSELALKQQNYEEIAGLGAKTEYDGHIIYAGNQELLEKNGISAPNIEEAGTVIYVAKDGKYIGYVLLQDVIRNKAKELIKKLDNLGIKTVLLSGDKLSTVEYVAKEVGIKHYRAKLLPQDKTKFVEEEIEKNKSKKLVAFAGDGINDTPSIIRADVGFAMGGIGSDVAVENADVVIMQDHPLKIYDSIVIAKKTRFIALFNIIFSLLVKVSVIVLLMVGILGSNAMMIAMLADTGLTVVMTLNSLLLIYRKIQ